MISIVGKQIGRTHPESLSESGTNGNARGVGGGSGSQPENLSSGELQGSEGSAVKTVPGT